MRRYSRFDSLYENTNIATNDDIISAAKDLSEAYADYLEACKDIVENYGLDEYDMQEVTDCMANNQELQEYWFTLSNKKKFTVKPYTRKNGQKVKGFERKGGNQRGWYDEKTKQYFYGTAAGAAAIAAGYVFGGKKNKATNTQNMNPMAPNFENNFGGQVMDSYEF